MSFLSGFGNALGGLASGILGGVLGKNFGGPNNYQKQGYNLLNSGSQTALQTAPSFFNRSGMFFNQGSNLLNRAQNTLASPTNYYQSLLSGSPAATTSALAPDINRIRGGTQQTLQAQSMLAPRGGGRESTLFNLPFQNQAQVSGLFNQMRPLAAQGLTGIGGMLGNLGLGTSGLGLGAGQVGTGLLNSGNYAGGLMGQLGTEFARQQAGAGAGFGGGLNSIFRSLPPWPWGTGGGGGGGGGSNVSLGDFGFNFPMGPGINGTNVVPYFP